MNFDRLGSVLLCQCVGGGKRKHAGACRCDESMAESDRCAAMKIGVLSRSFDRTVP